MFSEGAPQLTPVAIARSNVSRQWSAGLRLLASQFLRSLPECQPAIKALPGLRHCRFEPRTMVELDPAFGLAGRAGYTRSAAASFLASTDQNGSFSSSGGVGTEERPDNGSDGKRKRHAVRK
jgi:hypothetical protein